MEETLSQFLKGIQGNEQLNWVQHKDITPVLERAHRLFHEVHEKTLEDSVPTREIVSILLPRIIASWTAGVRVVLGGQAIESLPLFRLCLEQSLYGLHISLDPNFPARQNIWKRRDDSADALRKCRNEFKWSKVRDTCKGINEETANLVDGLYKMMIGFGAHPNSRGILGLVSPAENNSDYLAAHIVYNYPRLTGETLLGAALVASATLQVFQLLYPEHFTIMDIDPKNLGRQVHSLRETLGWKKSPSGREDTN